MPSTDIHNYSPQLKQVQIEQSETSQNEVDTPSPNLSQEKNQKSSSRTSKHQFIIWSLAAFLLVSIAGLSYWAGRGDLLSTLTNISSGTQACTLEAKVCPDGSIVGRVGPNCEFDACLDSEIINETSQQESGNLQDQSESEMNTLTQDKVEEVLAALPQLPAGMSLGTSNPKIEAVIFADLTEDNFSGRALKEFAPYLEEKYGDSIRLWYVHSVFPYRENADLLSSIGVLKCVGEQESVWNQMSALVDARGQHIYNYDVPNRLAFNQCITDILLDEEYQRGVINMGLNLMVPAQVQGIPTVVFISNEKKESHSIQGALPLDEFESQASDAIEALLR